MTMQDTGTQDFMSTENVHAAAIPAEELLRQCEVTRTRRQGPGGQHRNKVETAIVLTHRPTGVRSEANERRSQRENHRVALHRLRVNLALAVRSKRKSTECGEIIPSALWRGRLVGRRIVVSRKHDDFPAMLAEALDAIEQRKFDVAMAAHDLIVSASQLIKLLRAEPRALKGTNDHRAKLGMKVLR